MSSGRPQEVVDYIVENVLRPNMTDINDKRASRKGSGYNWIYSDLPRATNDMPRIGVEFDSGGAVPEAIGSLNVRQRPVIQVQVKMTQGNKYDIDNDGNKEKTEDCIDYLEDRVIKLIKAHHDDIVDNCPAEYVRFTNDNRQNPPDDGFIYQNAIFETMITRG